MKSYKDLIFWQKAKEVSILIIHLTRKLPSEKTAWIISDQIIRSSLSVGSNIAEGFGRYKGKEYIRFIQISLGSARETEYWLEILAEIYPNISSETNSILQKNSETIKMLIATINTLNTKKIRLITSN